MCCQTMELTATAHCRCKKLHRLNLHKSSILATHCLMLAERTEEVALYTTQAFFPVYVLLPGVKFYAGGLLV